MEEFFPDFGKTESKSDVESEKEFFPDFGKTEEPPNPLVGLGKGIYRGAAYGLPEMLGRSAKYLGVTGETVEGMIKRGEENTKAGQEGAFETAGEMIPASVGIPLVTGAVGKLLRMAPHPMLKAIGYGLQGLGAFATPAMFGLSQAQQTEETARERGVEPGAAPKITGAIEWLGETAANIALMRLFGGFGKVFTSPATVGKMGAAAALKGTLGAYLKELATVQLPTEVLTEMGQNYGEAFVEKKYGIRPEAEPGKEALSAVAPTTIMTALLGPFGRIAQTNLANKQAEILSKPVQTEELSPEDITRSKTVRFKVAEGLSEVLPKELKGQWLSYSANKIANNLPIDVASPIDSLSMTIDDRIDKMGGIPGMESINQAEQQKEVKKVAYPPEIPPVGFGVRGETKQKKVGPVSFGIRGGEKTPKIKSQPSAPLLAEIDRQANEAATSPLNEFPEPTDAQKEAGNFKKGHVSIQGLNISIENPAGSTRKGTDETGKEWETPIKNHYGHILGTEGKDKDPVDVFVGNNPDSTKVFVVDQKNPQTDKFDEHKTMVGFKTKEEARQGYLNNYDETGPSRIQAITEMTMGQFKNWLASDTTKPAAEATLKEPENRVLRNIAGIQKKIPPAFKKGHNTSALAKTAITLAAKKPALGIVPADYKIVKHDDGKYYVEAKTKEEKAREKLVQEKPKEKVWAHHKIVGKGSVLNKALDLIAEHGLKTTPEPYPGPIAAKGISEKRWKGHQVLGAVQGRGYESTKLLRDRLLKTFKLGLGKTKGLNKAGVYTLDELAQELNEETGWTGSGDELYEMLMGNRADEVLTQGEKEEGFPEEEDIRRKEEEYWQGREEEELYWNNKGYGNKQNILAGELIIGERVVYKGAEYVVTENTGESEIPRDTDTVVLQSDAGTEIFKGSDKIKVRTADSDFADTTGKEDDISQSIIKATKGGVGLSSQNKKTYVEKITDWASSLTDASSKKDIVRDSSGALPLFEDIPDDVADIKDQELPSLVKPGETTTRTMDDVHQVEMMYNNMIREDPSRVSVDEIFQNIVDSLLDKSAVDPKTLNEMDVEHSSLNQFMLLTTLQKRVENGSASEEEKERLKRYEEIDTEIVKLRKQLKDTYDAGYNTKAYTWINEESSNKYYALDEKIDALKIKKAETFTSFVSITDKGIGMTPEDLRDKFLKVAAQAKKAVHAGAHGIGKVVFLAWPKSWTVETIAYDNIRRKTVKTVIHGTGRGFLSGKEQYDISNYEIVPDNTQTGTMLRFNFGNVNDATAMMKNIKDLPNRSKCGMYINIKSIDGSETIKIPRLDSLEAKYGIDKTVTFRGNKYRVKFIEDLYPAWGHEGFYPVNWDITNKGVPLKLDSRALSFLSLGIKPDFKVHIDFIETVADDKSPNFPFRDNRSRIIEQIKEDIEKLANDKIREINSGKLTKDKQELEDALSKVSPIDGIKVFIPYTDQKSIDETKDLVSKNKPLFQVVSKIFGLYQAAAREFLVTRKSDIWGKITQVNLAVAMLPPGQSKTGDITSVILGFRPTGDLVKISDSYFVNPFGVEYSRNFGEIYKGYVDKYDNEDRIDGIILIDTLTHELVHQMIKGHGPDFNQVFADYRTVLNISGRQAEMEKIAEGMYREFRDDIRKITEDIKRISQSGNQLSFVKADQVSIRPNVTGRGKRVFEADTGLQESRQRAEPARGQVASITKAKELAGRHSSWADFKKKLGDYLGVTFGEKLPDGTIRSVSKEWQYAYLRSAGRSHDDVIQQLGLPKDFTLGRQAAAARTRPHRLPWSQSSYPYQMPIIRDMFEDYPSALTGKLPKLAQDKLDRNEYDYLGEKHYQVIDAVSGNAIYTWETKKDAEDLARKWFAKMQARKEMPSEGRYWDNSPAAFNIIGAMKKRKTGSFSPAEAIKIFEDATGKKLKYGFLVPHLEKFGVKISFDSSLITGGADRVFGVYDSEDNIVVFSRQGFELANNVSDRFEEAFAHEAIHGIVINILKSKTQEEVRLRNKLRKFISELRPHLKYADPKIQEWVLKMNAVPDELITYAFTNQKFADFLASIKVPGEKVKTETLWSKLKRIILDAVDRYSPIGKTKLDELNEIMDHFIDVKPFDHFDHSQSVNPEDRLLDGIFKGFAMEAPQKDKFTAKYFIGMDTREKLRAAIDEFFGVNDELHERWYDGEIPDNILLRLDNRFSATIEELAVDKDYEELEKILNKVKKAATAEDYQKLDEIKRTLGVEETPKGEFETGNLPGVPTPEEGFELTPEGEVGPKIVQKPVPPKQGNLFEVERELNAPFVQLEMNRDFVESLRNQIRKIDVDQMPQKDYDRMVEAMGRYGGMKYKMLRYWFSLPRQNAQKSKDWRTFWNIFKERVESRNNLIYERITDANPFLNRANVLRDKGYSREQRQDFTYRLGRVITIGDSGVNSLRNILHNLKIAAGQTKDPAIRQVLNKRIEQLQKDRAYSFADLKRGIKDFDGKFVRLNNETEYEIYRSVRGSLDNQFKSIIHHLELMLYRAYRKQKWFHILSAATGAPLNSATTKAILGAGLDDAALTYAQKVQVDINAIWDRIGTSLDRKEVIEKMSPEEKAKVANEYEKISDTVAEDLKDMRKFISEMTGEKDPAALEEITRDVFAAYQLTRPQLKNIKKLRNSFNDWIGFFPRKREPGNYKVTLHSLTPDPDTGAPITKELFSQMFNTEKQGQDIYNKLLSKYGQNGVFPENIIVKFDPVVKTPEGAFQGISDINVQKIIDQALQNMNSKKDYYDKEGQPVDIVKELVNDTYLALSAMMQSRGAAAHGIHRKQELGEPAIMGFLEENHDQTLMEYFTSMSGLMSKQVAAFDALSAMKELSDPSRFDELRTYVNGQLRNDTELDKLSSKFRSFAFTWYLGGLIKSAAVNATQPIIVGVPMLSRYMGKYGLGSFSKANRIQMKASWDIMKFWTDPSVLSQIEKDFIQKSIADGSVQAQHIQFIRGEIEGMRQAYKNFRQVTDYLAAPFAQVEIFNRKTSGLAMFRVAYGRHIKEGMEEKDAIKAATKDAHEFIDMVHYPIGKHNLPLPAQGGDYLSVGLKTAYTFRVFTHNFLLNLFNLFNAKGKTKADAYNDLWAAVQTMSYVAMFGGMMGLPFLKDIFEWFEKWFGYSPKEYLRKSLRSVGGPTLETMGMSGLPAVLGANISGSLAIGIPFMGETPSDTVYGVYGGQATKLKRAFEAATIGDWYRVTTNLSPEFIRGPVVALQESKVGKEYLGTPGYTTTAKGKPSWTSSGEPLSLSGGEAAFKSLGFQPTRYGRERELEQTTKRLESWVNEEKTRISQTYRMDKLQKDPKAMTKLVFSVKELNKKIKTRKIPVAPASVSRILINARPTKNLQKRREERFKEELTT